MGNCELSGKPDEMLGVTMQWTNVPSKEEKRYSSLLHAKDTRIRSGWVDHMTAEFLTYQSFRHSD